MKLSTRALAAMLALTGISGRADAAVVINLHEVGSDVIASASGSADLTDLTLIATTILFAPGEVTPKRGGATVGDRARRISTKAPTVPHRSGPAARRKRRPAAETSSAFLP
jgi:hypothetical protein